MVEELLGIEGDDMDLRLLAQSFPSKTPRLEKRKVTVDGEERYFLVLENETPREDADVLAEGKRVLAEMTANMLQDRPNFRPPRIRGLTKKTADGFLITFLNVSDLDLQKVTQYQRDLLKKIDVLFGPSGSEEPPAELLRSNASDLAIDRVREEKWVSDLFSPLMGLMIIILALTLYTLLGMRTAGLPTAFAEPANILGWLVLAIGHGFMGGFEQLLENPVTFGRYLFIMLVWAGGLSFLWLLWIAVVFRLVAPSRLQLRMFLIALPIALGFLAPALFSGSTGPNFSRSHAKFDGVILSVTIELLVLINFIISKAVGSMLRSRHRRLRPIEYLLNSLFETLCALREIPQGDILERSASEKRASILANLEDAAWCLQAVSRLTPVNDRLIASLKQEAFDRRVQGLRELKMAVVLPKADTRTCLDEELRRILGLLAVGDWEGLPVNNHDVKKMEPLLGRSLTLVRSLLIPVIILAIIYLAQEKIPVEVRNNLVVVACGYALITILPLIDPRFKETLVALKDFPWKPNE
jgi:hypothetical protein